MFHWLYDRPNPLQRYPAPIDLESSSELIVSSASPSPKGRSGLVTPRATSGFPDRFADCPRHTQPLCGSSRAVPSGRAMLHKGDRVPASRAPCGVLALLGRLFPFLRVNDEPRRIVNPQKIDTNIDGLRSRHTTNDWIAAPTDERAVHVNIAIGDGQSPSGRRHGRPSRRLRQAPRTRPHQVRPSSPAANSFLTGTTSSSALPNAPTLPATDGPTVFV